MIAPLTSPTRLLDDLRAAGFGLRVDAGRLLVSPRERLTDGLSSAIRGCRDELVVLVKNQPADLIPWGEGPDTFPRPDSPDYAARTVDASDYQAFWKWMREWNEMIRQRGLEQDDKTKRPGRSRQRSGDQVGLLAATPPPDVPTGAVLFSRTAIGHPCRPEDAYMWTWSSGPGWNMATTWYYTTQHAPPKGHPIDGTRCRCKKCGGTD